MEIITKKTPHVVVSEKKIMKETFTEKEHTYDKKGCFWKFPDSFPHPQKDD